MEASTRVSTKRSADVVDRLAHVYCLFHVAANQQMPRQKNEAPIGRGPAVRGGPLPAKSNMGTSGLAIGEDLPRHSPTTQDAEYL